MLIVGCDIGGETHYARAIDTRDRELSKKALAFENDAEGFRKIHDWAVQLATVNKKQHIVLELEPTGHYWFCLAAWMVSNGMLWSSFFVTLVAKKYRLAAMLPFVPRMVCDSR